MERAYERVGGAARDRPKSRSAGSDRPTRGGAPQAARLEGVEKVLIHWAVVSVVLKACF